MTTPGNAAPQGAMSLADWGKLLLLGAIWGGSFFLARISVAHIHPLTLVLLRVGIAAAALQIYLAARGISLRPALARAPDFVLLALLNNIIPFSLIFAGQTELGAGLSSVLNATTPFWTVVIAAALVPSEKVGWNKLAGIALGIAGTAVTVGPGLVAGLGGPVWAKLVLVGAAISYAFASLFGRRFSALPPPVVAGAQLTTSTLLMIPVVLIGPGFGGALSAPPHVWLAVVAIALVSTAFAYILFFQLLASAGATNTSLVTLVVPSSAILLGAAFLGERMEAFEMAGMALIALGLVVIDGRLLARFRAG